MALAGALCNTLLTAAGIANKSLRALMTGLLNTPYTPGHELRPATATPLRAHPPDRAH
jgi:hypothetical protein